MRAYKFYSAKWGREALLENRLKISRISELNDPFDFLSISMKSKKEREDFYNLRNFINEHEGIISFSKTWQEPLLWSHYADCHKGMCLEFELVDPEQWFMVDYISKRVPVKFKEGMQLAAIEKLAANKHRNWSYEQEVRTLHDLKTSKKYLDLYFEYFSDHMKLKRIILGPLYETVGSRLNAILDKQKIPIRTTRLAFKSYKVVTQEAANMQIAI